MAAIIATVIGIIGNIISIMMFLAPMKVFRRVFKNKNTEDFKGTPYVFTMLSTMTWTFYGLLKPGLLIVTINVAGTAFEVFYTSVYLRYAPKARKILTLQQLTGVLTSFCLIVLLTLVLTNDHHTRTLVTGCLSVVFTIGMYAAPLTVMRMVIQTKSVEYMPFTLSMLLFLNGVVWFIYALVVGDIFVGIPNGIGTLLGALQLTMYAIYRKATPDKLPEINVADGKDNGGNMKPADDHFVNIDNQSSTVQPEQLQQKKDVASAA